MNYYTLTKFQPKLSKQAPHQQGELGEGRRAEGDRTVLLPRQPPMIEALRAEH